MSTIATCYEPCTLPLPSSNPEIPSADTCTCDPFCDCYSGTGTDLVSLLQWGIARNKAKLTLGGHTRKDAASLTRRTRRAGLMLAHEQLKAGVRAEFGVN